MSGTLCTPVSPEYPTSNCSLHLWVASWRFKSLIGLIGHVPIPLAVEEESGSSAWLPS